MLFPCMECPLLLSVPSHLLFIILVQGEGHFNILAWVTSLAAGSCGAPTAKGADMPLFHARTTITVFHLLL